MFNTFEIINSHHIKNKKNIEDLAEALTKTEQVRDDALTIVERMEKDSVITVDRCLHWNN